jgi:hypothetical protein
MTHDRREFLQTVAIGAAGFTAVSALPLDAQSAVFTRANRKMVVRADDIGMSRFCNIGAFEAIENGVVTAADVMLDSPGTEDALERLKKIPWISIGWHTHMWGACLRSQARAVAHREDRRIRREIQDRSCAGPGRGLRRGAGRGPRSTRQMREDPRQGSRHRRRQGECPVGQGHEPGHGRVRPGRQLHRAAAPQREIRGVPRQVSEAHQRPRRRTGRSW